jgi:hypothetical protein
MNERAVDNPVSYRKEGVHSYMLLKPRLALLGVLSLLVTCGAVASVASASGPAWKVQGKFLQQGKVQIKMLAGPTEFKGKVALTETTIRCARSRSNAGFIEGHYTAAGGGGGEPFTFEQCVVLTPIGCLVQEPITHPSFMLLVYDRENENIGVVIGSTQSIVFVTFHFESKPKEKCAITEPVEFKGSVVANLKPGREQTKLGGELEFPTTPITEVKHEGVIEKDQLFVGPEVAQFSGKYGIRLEQNQEFGAF